MRYLVALSTLAALVLGPERPQHSRSRASVDPYLRIQQTLAADEDRGHPREATAIVSGAAKLGKPAEAIAAAGRQLQGGQWHRRRARRVLRA